MPIPEAELAAKRDLVKRGQAHRKFRKDPADPPADRPDRPTGGRRHRLPVSHPHVDKRRKREPDSPVDTTAPTPDTREVVPRPTSPMERRLASCTVNLEQWYTPEATHELETGTASDAGRPGDPPVGGERTEAPQGRTRRPEGMPEAQEGPGTYQPAPVEDDQLVGGQDGQELGMEIDVNLGDEYEDLNADTNQWDVKTDSPHPHSPTAADALDYCVLGQEPPPGAPFDVLREVPSTQPETPSTTKGASARRHRSRSRRQATERTRSAQPPTALTPPTSTASAPILTLTEQGYAAGRGILRLRAPPKLARTPAPRRRPPPCGNLPEPQWVIPVVPTPVVTYRALTPEPENRLPETPEQFADGDEDLRPLEGRWVDIVDREIQEGTAVISTAPEVTWAVGAPTVAASTVTTVVTMALNAPTTVTEVSQVGIRSDSPTVIASTPGASQPESGLAPIAPVGSTSGPLAAVAAPPLLSATPSQTDLRPVLRFSDIAYAVRLSQAGQTEQVADSLLDNFETRRTREELIFAIRAMSALLRDVGAFLRERVVGARLVHEPLQSVHNDLVGALDRFMGDDDHHHPA